MLGASACALHGSCRQACWGCGEGGGSAACVRACLCSAGVPSPLCSDRWHVCFCCCCCCTRSVWRCVRGRTPRLHATWCPLPRRPALKAHAQNARGWREVGLCSEDMCPRYTAQTAMPTDMPTLAHRQQPSRYLQHAHTKHPTPAQAAAGEPAACAGPG